MSKSKKTQFTIEFVMLISLMFVIFVTFFAVVSYRFSEVGETEKKQKTENIAILVDDEVKLARLNSDGFERTFELPKKIEGSDYTVEIIDDRELVVNYGDYEHVLFLPENVVGNVNFGLNKIKKIDGVIYLNNIEPPPECNDGSDNDNDGDTDHPDDGGCLTANDDDETNCGDGECEGGEICSFCIADCGMCPSQLLLLMKGASNVISFGDNGDVILKETLDKLNPDPQPTADDEFIFKDSFGDEVAIINLVTGNMVIKGDLYENEPALSNPATNDFIVKNSDGDIVSYIDESGNFYLKGALIHGNP